MTRRVLAWAGSILALVVVAGVIAFEPIARWYVVREAARHGVILRLGGVDLGWSSVVLERFRFALAGVDGVEAKVERLALAIDGRRPTAVDITGMELNAEGTATELLLAGMSWANDHPELLALPLTARGVDIVWRPIADDAAGAVASPWLTIDDATISPSADGASLDAPRVAIVGFDVGSVGAVWRGDEAVIDVGLGLADPSSAPLRLTLRHALAVPEADVALSPVALRDLAGPLGMALPIDGVTASGEVKLFWLAPAAGAPALAIDAPIEGHASVKLVGYRPPVPKEVEGFVFGDTTQLETDLSIDASRRNVSLSATTVAHGSVVLSGSGRITRHDDHAIASLELTGSLSCSQLAEAAARARIGGIVGNVAGTVAGLVVAGSVSVTLRLEADTRRLQDATMERTIGIGCGLRPGLIPKLPRLEDLPKIDLPKLDLPKLD